MATSDLERMLDDWVMAWSTMGYPKEGAAITSRVAFQNPTLA